MKYRMMAVMSVAILVLSLCSFPKVASAQSDREALGAMYSASATIPTNIRGINTFPAPPVGFNPLQAGDMDLARYGYPLRPDPQVDADSYARWAKAVKVMRFAPDPNKLKEMPYSSRPGRQANPPAGTSEADATSAAPGTKFFFNWSGIANTNKLTKYTENTSFYLVNSEFNTPVAQQAFNSSSLNSGNICDGATDIQVAWNGIDGLSNATVLQGGSESVASCSGGHTSSSYCDWIEWYPSYGIVCVIDAPTPGDDLFVQTENLTGGTNPQVVCVTDETLNTGGCFSLTWKSGPGLVGNSAEYIVERPCCVGPNEFPLANYVYDFWADSFAYDFINFSKNQTTPYYPGSTAATTFLISMVNDQDSEVISTAAAQGKNGIFFNDENCALDGGCTP